MSTDPNYPKNIESNLLGDYVGKDKHVHGDEVHGDKFFGDKIIIYQYSPSQSGASIETTLQMPPEPAHPPDISNFVGREEELAYFASKLEEHNYAVICGMAGVGKTALATMLIKWVADQRNVFWHTFHENEGIETVIRQLAGFLAWHGMDELWKSLELTRITGGKPPSTSEQFDYLLQMLRNGKYLLCFDDFHEIEHDPDFALLIEKLRNAVASNLFSLILTSRRMPDFARMTDFEPLDGLRLPDVNRLLKKVEIPLTDAQIQSLFDTTAGNAEFLTLVVDALNQGKDPQILVTNLAETTDIESYLLREVDDVLTGDERAVMSAVATLLSYGGTREAVEALLYGRNVFRILRRLQDRYLLVVQRKNAESTYGQHALVRGFYYESLSKQERRVLHQRAGSFYADKLGSLLLSSIHYERSGEYVTAAEQVTKDVWSIINQGEAHNLRILLEKFQPNQLNVEQWIKVNLARGLNFTFLNNREKAVQIYHDIISGYKNKQDFSIYCAQAYQGLGELFELEEPLRAADYYQRGLDKVPEKSGVIFAGLQIGLGTAQMYTVNYSAAKRSFQSGLEHLAGEFPQQRMLALKNLSALHIYQGQHEAAIEYGQQALEISKKINNRFEMTNILMNLAISTYEKGKWENAVKEFQNALAIAHSLGNKQLQVSVTINLGATYISMGDDSSAMSHLYKCIKLANEENFQLISALAYCRLADLYVRRRDWDLAQEFSKKAKVIANELGHEGLQIPVYTTWAEIYLALNEVDSALLYANKAVKIAESLEEQIDWGISLRVRGQIYSKKRQFNLAKNDFQKSLSLLMDRELYESARTKMQMGSMFLANSDSDEGKLLLSEAYKVFKKLGAIRDLKILNAFQGSDEI